MFFPFFLYFYVSVICLIDCHLFIINGTFIPSFVSSFVYWFFIIFLIISHRPRFFFSPPHSSSKIKKIIHPYLPHFMPQNWFDKLILFWNFFDWKINRKNCHFPFPKTQFIPKIIDLISRLSLCRMISFSPWPHPVSPTPRVPNQTWNLVQDHQRHFRSAIYHNWWSRALIHR